MSDFNCPYCDAELDVCHDDGLGYEEDVKHEMQCGVCDKNFVFETSIMFHYEPKKADCLNTGSHNLKPVKHFPQYWPDWVRCEDCAYEKRGEYKEPEELLRDYN